MKKKFLTKSTIAEIVLLVLGVVLAIDSFFVHALVLNYVAYGISWLDPFLSHGVVGVIFIIISLIGLGWKIRKR